MTDDRNLPCRCGSGRKYKKCHLALDREAERHAQLLAGAKHRGENRALPPEILEEWQRRERDERERRAREGDVRRVIHTDFNEHKFVAVGSTLHWSKTWKTFIDFLQDYIKRVLGGDWGNAELAKAPEDRHIVIQWYQLYCTFQKTHGIDQDGLKVAVPDGPSLAYLALAYDLYILADHQKLQETLVARLRHRDQFQGARYELAVAATMIRAGFTLEHEDETDSTTKHPEFIATMKSTGERVAVEAKSRHRAGILGREGAPVGREQFKLGITDLLRKAVAKGGTLPFLIFIDANMPPAIAVEDQKAWLSEFGETLMRVGHGFNAVGVVQGTPFSGLVLTNWAEHYGEVGVPYPQGIGMVSWPSQPLHPFASPGLLRAVETAVKQYGNIPSRFPK